jgi:phosphoenolpyruvate synthase/pyruvate phosphate dikinase
MTTPWLRTLDEIEGGDLPLVGGKAFNLAVLRRHGLPVPNGLVVTATFFETQLKRRQFIPLWAGSPEVAVTEGALSWLADTLKITPLSPELKEALFSRLADVFPKVDLFAVRSSAIDEDAPGHAFSGIHLSELGVPRDAVPISLARCWASAFSKPALQYRQQHGLSIQAIRLAVLIQPFVRPTVAGVAFTVNPLSGARDELVVEASPGVGTAVVSGQVTPTRYRLAKRPPNYPLIDRTAGSDTSAAGNGHGPLSASQLRTIAQYLEQIEALMAAPQDIEWAITTDRTGGREGYYFLQTRPITALPGVSTPLDVEWSRVNYRELLPDLPSPLCTSLMERTQAHALSSFRRLGFNLENSGPYLKIIYGRPYLNLTVIRHLATQSGLQPAGLLWIVGHAEAPSQLGATYPVDWQQMWSARRAVASLLWRGQRVETWYNRCEHLSYEVRRSLAATNWANASPAELLNLFRLRIQLSNQMIETEFIITAATVAAVTVAAHALATAADNVEQTVRKLASLGTETTSTRQGRAMLKLAGIVRGDEQVKSYLSNPGDGFRGYRKALRDTTFLAVFDEFLAGYGGRATFEADPGWPRYGEEPSALLATAAEIAGADVLPNPEETDDQRRREEAQAWADLRLDSGLDKWVPWRCWLARTAIRRLHDLTQMRDQLRTVHGRAITACRAWDLNLGERWTARHWLAEPEDYFWLTMEEVERGLMAESEVGPTLPALVRARRETYQTYAATEMPYVLRESDVAQLAPGHGLIGTALSSVLSGLPVSPGQVQGRVVVLHKPDEADRMQDGAILVTPSTDPAWFPTFLRARGLIVETGGLLSHGSIIAREFGLPAVANIFQATGRFHDGDLVLLDGSTGLVQILEPAAGPDSLGRKGD